MLCPSKINILHIYLQNLKDMGIMYISQNLMKSIKQEMGVLVSIVLQFGEWFCDTLETAINVRAIGHLLKKISWFRDAQSDNDTILWSWFKWGWPGVTNQRYLDLYNLSDERNACIKLVVWWKLSRDGTNVYPGYQKFNGWCTHKYRCWKSAMCVVVA